MSLTVLHHMEGGKEIIQKVKKGKEMDHTHMQGGTGNNCSPKRDCVNEE